MDNWITLFTAWSVAIPASLLGVLLVLRQKVLIGDAISHAVLPGIVVAYLLTDSRESIPVLIGAAIMGVLTTILIDFLNRKLRIQQDAAIGTAFTFLFALGVLLIAFFAGTNTDLDQECVLYGDLETSILDQVIIGGWMIGTRSILMLFPLIIVVITIVLIGFKGWRIWGFNPDFGTTIGMKMARWELVLMILVSIHAVLSFESVGVIMVIGLLVLPASCAITLFNDLKSCIVASALIGMGACVAGVFLAIELNCSIAPTIVAVNGIGFIFIVAFKSQMNHLKRVK